MLFTQVHEGIFRCPRCKLLLDLRGQSMRAGSDALDKHERECTGVHPQNKQPNGPVECTAQLDQADYRGEQLELF